MIIVDNDNQLLIQDGGWNEEDAAIIDANPTYKVRGIYFPADYVAASGRTAYTTEEMKQDQYYNDEGVTIIVTYFITVNWLSAVATDSGVTNG